MLKATIWRILGNDMPPRDKPGKRLAVLADMLNKEPEYPEAQKWFLLNRIVDPEWHTALCKLLNNSGARYVNVPFNSLLRPDYETIRLQGININAARNEAISFGHAIAPWSVILDGDCTFTKGNWDLILKEMQATEHTPYLSIPHVREGSSNQGEPMLAFHSSSTERFDESIPFGDCDKLNLLWRLGHSKTPGEAAKFVEGSQTKLVGEVTHRSTGVEDTETNLQQRERLRRASIRALCDKVKNLYPKRPPAIAASTRPQVLFCGLNKTGTTSLHQAFLSAGLTAYHGKQWISWVNQEKLPVEYDMYCDGATECLSMTRLSRIKHCHIILNTRPLFSWLVSRCKLARAGHKRGRWPDFTREDIWKWYLTRVRLHKRLLRLDPFIFNIEDKSSHSKLAEHLGIPLKLPHTNKRDTVTDDITEAITSVLSKHKIPKESWNTLHDAF